MGAAEALMFAKEGAHVVIGDILEKEGEKTASEIDSPDARCLFEKLDVLKASDWESVIERIISTFGKLDILVNNAGVTSREMLLETSEMEWDRVMDINTKGTFLGIKTAIPALKSSGGGSIINISSQMGLVGADYISPQYQASKGAVRILTKSVAIQYASDNIRCNSVHPAPIETDMTAHIRENADTFQK